MQTKAYYISTYFYEHYLVLFTTVPRNSSVGRRNKTKADEGKKRQKSSRGKKARQSNDDYYIIIRETTLPGNVRGHFEYC